MNERSASRVEHAATTGRDVARGGEARPDTPKDAASDLDALKTEPAPLDDSALQLLMAEHAHLGASFLDSEAAGEKRVNTFLTLIGGVVAGLGLAADSLAGSWPLVGLVSSSVLLVFGLMTARRIMGRNMASTEYVNGLRRIRAWWVAHDVRRIHALPFPPGPDPIPRKHPSRKGFGKGGWLETTAATNCVLAGLAGLSGAWMALDGFPAGTTGGALGLGIVALVAVTWVLQVRWAKDVYRKLEKGSATRRRQAEAYWLSADPAPQADPETGTN